MLPVKRFVPGHDSVVTGVVPPIAGRRSAVYVGRVVPLGSRCWQGLDPLQDVLRVPVEELPGADVDPLGGSRQLDDVLNLAEGGRPNLEVGVDDPLDAEHVAFLLEARPATTDAAVAVDEAPVGEVAWADEPGVGLSLRGVQPGPQGEFGFAPYVLEQVLRPVAVDAILAEVPGVLAAEQISFSRVEDEAGEVFVSVLLRVPRPEFIFRPSVHLFLKAEGRDDFAEIAHSFYPSLSVGVAGLLHLYTIS